MSDSKRKVMGKLVIHWTVEEKDLYWKHEQMKRKFQEKTLSRSPTLLESLAVLVVPPVLQAKHVVLKTEGPNLNVDLHSGKDERHFKAYAGPEEVISDPMAIFGLVEETSRSVYLDDETLIQEFGLDMESSGKTAH